VDLYQKLCSGVSAEIEILYIWAFVAAAVRATRACVLLPIRLDSSMFPLTQQMLGWFAIMHG
jgi:hypothetical protein